MKLLQIPVLKCAAAILLSVFSLLAYAAEPVAMITDLKGKVQLNGAKTHGQAAMLTYLAAGEEVVLDAGAALVLTYFDEAVEYSYKGPARILIEQKSPKVVKGGIADVRQLDKEKSLGVSKFARSGKLAFATVEMRSMVIKPTLLSPVSDKISTTTPLFAWKSVNEAEGYLLTLSENGGKPVQQIAVTTNSWQVPSETPLKPGMKYHWSVEETLKSGEKTTVIGGFSVADAETMARVNSKRPANSASLSEKVTYALYLESEGFREDAKQVWRELAAQRPDDPNLKFRAR
ncbi:MAG TPA: hypothetical protein VFW59_04520 [Gallionella sp.]|nr:hypothetical protein [Gallionella sp.]